MKAADPLARSVLQVTDQIQRAVPFARFEYKSVVMGTAGTDQAINHNLQPTRPDDVGYVVVQQSAAGSVFQDLSATRRAWTSSTIYLRSDTASLRCILLIFTPAISMPTLIENL